MRTIKLTRDQFRTWRLNAPSVVENELSDREKLKQELLEQNGGQSFRLMSPMARFIGTVRGENSVVSGAPMGTPNGVPAPESCVCKQYAGTKPGEHHAVCQFRQAWENGHRHATVSHGEPEPGDECRDAKGRGAHRHNAASSAHANSETGEQRAGGDADDATGSRLATT